MPPIIEIKSIAELSAEKDANMTEHYIKMHIMKPDNMPNWLFNYFVKKCVRLEHFYKNKSKYRIKV